MVITWNSQMCRVPFLYHKQASIQLQMFCVMDVVLVCWMSEEDYASPSLVHNWLTTLDFWPPSPDLSVKGSDSVIYDKQSCGHCPRPRQDRFWQHFAAFLLPSPPPTYLAGPPAVQLIAATQFSTKSVGFLLDTHLEAANELCSQIGKYWVCWTPWNLFL